MPRETWDARSSPSSRGDRSASSPSTASAPASKPALAGAGDGHVVHAGVDLTDAAAVAAVIDATVKAFGQIDGVVHTVGGFAYAPIAESVATALFSGCSASTSSPR